MTRYDITIGEQVTVLKLEITIGFPPAFLGRLMSWVSL